MKAHLTLLAGIILGFSGAGLTAAQTAPATATVPATQDTAKAAAKAEAKRQANLIVTNMARTVHDCCDSVLAHPGVSAEEKKNITALVKEFDGEVTKLQNDEQIGEKGWYAYAMMEKLSGPPTEYVTSRNALYWVSLRANLLMMGERGALMSLAMPGGKPELYPAALKAAGVNDDSMGKVQKVLDHFTADAKAALAVAKDPAATPTIRQEAQSKVLVLADSARKEIRGLLTAEQNIDLDWAILQIGLPPGQRGGNIVTMSALSGAVKAPVDGTYVLQTSDSKGAPATHATVTLKKGTPLSFRMTDKGLKGIAGEKEFDVPGTPAPVAAWNYEREK